MTPTRLIEDGTAARRWICWCNDTDDPDVGDPLTITNVAATSAQGGLLTNNGTTVGLRGTCRIIVGDDTFTYTANDGTARLQRGDGDDHGDGRERRPGGRR